MIGAEERRRLMARLGSDPVSPLGAVLKCVAGILVLVIIAAGPWAFLSAGGPTAASEGHPASKVGAAQAESKRVFDERRRAFRGGRGAGCCESFATGREGSEHHSLHEPG
jgi:hypothetical protein